MKHRPQKSVLCLYPTHFNDLLNTPEVDIRKAVYIEVYAWMRILRITIRHQLSGVCLASMISGPWLRVDIWATHQSFIDQSSFYLWTVPYWFLLFLHHPPISHQVSRPADSSPLPSPHTPTTEYTPNLSPPYNSQDSEICVLPSRCWSFLIQMKRQ